jgi:excisionase family DNA binding protein
LSISEAAHLLKVSRQRVHVMLQSGKLDGVKVGSTWIIHRDSVEAYMARK